MTAWAEREPKPGTPLTDLELEVLTLVAEGLTNAQIGRRLFTNETTVGQRIYRARLRLGAKSRTHAVAIAVQAGVIKVES